ncbi:hypothetical protein IBT47_14995 [Erwinia sp. S43]|uniref:hypothetical protein n=1 Tax=Erwinia sp. S43 TaxID=2769339 RepID=UPI00190C2055|nr:hypothetical protein [Erwinia sp. S43]MBK0033597.1 hypothetical protein [Erwinia sp. S43]
MYFEKRNRIYHLFIAGMCLWLVWMMACLWLTRRVWLREGEYNGLITVSVACIIGLFAAWRHFLRGPEVDEGNVALLKTFASVTVFAFITLFNVPDMWVYLTASRPVQSEVAFTVEHPGPASSRFSRCPAGIRYYDVDLRRHIEFCASDSDIPPAARALRVEKRLGSLGGYIVSHRFI